MCPFIVRRTGGYQFVTTFLVLSPVTVPNVPSNRTGLVLPNNLAFCLFAGERRVGLVVPWPSHYPASGQRPGRPGQNGQGQSLHPLAALARPSFLKSRVVRLRLFRVGTGVTKRTW